MLETYEKNSTRKLVATVLAVIVIAGSTVLADHLRTKTTSAVSLNTSTASTPSPVTTSENTPASTPSTTSTSSSTTGAASTGSTSTTGSSSGVKDGTYSATSNYYVPHGDETIAVSLTVSNGTIINASIQNSESDRDSAQYQESFAAAYKNYVVGKKISGLQLNVIAGASDTTQGFNDALTKIAAEAQA